MTNSDLCSVCGISHDTSQLPVVDHSLWSSVGERTFAADLPDVLHRLPLRERALLTRIGADRVLAGGPELFQRCRIEIPIRGSDAKHIWIAWAKTEPADTVAAGPGFVAASLANEIPGYPTPRPLRGHLLPTATGAAPEFRLDSGPEPLAFAQERGYRAETSDVICAHMRHATSA